MPLPRSCARHVLRTFMVRSSRERCHCAIFGSSGGGEARECPADYTLSLLPSPQRGVWARYRTSRAKLRRMCWIWTASCEAGSAFELSLSVRAAVSVHSKKLISSRALFHGASRLPSDSKALRTTHQVNEPESCALTYAYQFNP